MDAIIVVPPCATTERPCIAAHILQASARAEGFKVEVLYANILFARLIGESGYKSIFMATMADMWGERIFARTAFGGPPLGKVHKEIIDRLTLQIDLLEGKNAHDFTPDFEKIRLFESKTDEWLSMIVNELEQKSCSIIGISVTFDQTCAAISIANAIKAKSQSSTVIIGGASCQGPMAKGMLSLSSQIDYICAGEGEKIFPDTIRKIQNGKRPSERILDRQDVVDLDTIPSLNYDDYFSQLSEKLPGNIAEKTRTLFLPYETSRGCWWGEKIPCTFCGLNGRNLGFRKKDPSHAVKELSFLVSKYPVRRILLTDNIIPKDYFKTFIPLIREQLPQISFSYEVRSNISFEDLINLKRAGAHFLQPGIEALSSSLLKRMSKGVLARHNVAFLRNAMSLDIEIGWNILYGFPGDTKQEYKETMELIKMIPHFQPPMGVTKISIDRFSEYHKDPKKYGIKEISPYRSYYDIFPKASDFHNLCIRFNGTYDSFILDDTATIKSLTLMVSAWKEVWRRGKEYRPRLLLKPINTSKALLIDSRRVSEGPTKTITVPLETAQICLKDWKKSDIKKEKDFEAIQWGIQNHLLADLDDYYISLIQKDIPNELL